MNNNSKITIICSNYNSSKWIEGYLECINNQSYENFDIIFVDAKSTDNSLESIKNFSFKKTINKKIICCSERISLYEAWNIAIKESCTDYVMNLNTDDRIYKNSIELYTNYLIQNPEIDLFYGPCDITYDEKHQYSNEQFNWPEYSHENLITQCICGPFPLVKKSAIEKAGYFDSSLLHSGDYEMWIRMSLLNCNFKRIPESIGSYFFNPVGLSTNPETKQRAFSEDDLIRRKYKNKNNKKLSILVPSLEDRQHFLIRLVNILKPQIEKFKKDVELLIFTDNRKYSIGDKRNALMFSASGEYIAYVDDDDLISENYVELILKAIENKPDVVGIHLLHFENGIQTGLTYHSLKYTHWWQEQNKEHPQFTNYYRNPNHINPIKREYALRTLFPPINMGEDKDYSKRILKYLKTEEYIETPIYTYLFISNK